MTKGIQKLISISFFVVKVTKYNSNIYIFINYKNKYGNNIKRY